MKWIFYLLLFSNLLYFGWEISHRPPVEASPTPTYPEKADSSIQDGVDQLLLLHEIPPERLRLRWQGKSENEKKPTFQSKTTAQGREESRENKRCYSLGPLSDEDPKYIPVDAVRAWLKISDIDGSLEKDRRREVAMYWLYIPPGKGRAEAEALVRSMNQQGIKDVRVWTTGDKKNAISLGLFRLRSSLEKRLHEIRQKGYRPVVGVRYKTEKAAWFDAGTPPDRRFPKEDFLERFPSLEINPLDCLN